ncbi:MAG: serpin family protein [Lawsonibacter sp.]|nr:serpin family protein [Lawsonibacter sp.]
MNRILSLLLACTLGLSMLPGCAPTSAAKELTAEPVKLTDADMTAHDQDALSVYAALSDLGLELLKQTRASNGENAMESGMDHVPLSTLVSPFSAAMALSMAANGAEGDTLAQFEEVLGDEASIEAVNVACQALMILYRNLAGSTKCTIANSLWVDPEGQIKDEFVGKCRGIFDAQVFSANLSDDAIVKDLNGWVSEHTNKMIPQIITEPFDQDTALVLVNALYLKNKWSQEFDPLHTREMDFHHAGGQDSRTEYLQHFNTQLSFIQGNGAQGVVLPYDDGRLAFFALLPDLYPDSPDLGEWLDSLEGNGLAELIQCREDTQFLHFAMPKFTAEWKGDLTGVLPLLGLADAFLPGTADFSSLGDSPEGYYISQVIHATKIEVNEKGTEAAAATVVAANSGVSMPPEDGVTLILDRPFLYGIIDLQNGVPLFLGTYE